MNSGRRSSRKRASVAPSDFAAWLAPTGQLWRLPLDLLLLTILLFAAFSYGATEPWSQQVVAGLAAALGLYVLIACFVPRSGCRPIGSWTYLPIGAFLALVVLQTVPLPAGLVASIAGGNHDTRVALLSDLEPAGSMAISLLPAATWRTLWALLPVIVVFVAALHAYRTEAGVRRLCVLMMLAAASVAGYALYQNLAGIGTKFGGAVSEHAFSGPFLNHSAFGQFVNLGIGGAVALLLFQFNALAKRHPRPADLYRKLTKEPQQLGLWLCVAVAVLGALAILLSMTRGGVLSLLIGGGLVGALLAWRSPHGSAESHHGAVGVSGGDRAALLLGVGLLVVVAALAVGFDQIFERLASLRDLETAEGGRTGILRSLLPAFASYPLWGTGLGTFEFVYPRYDTDAGRASLTTYAENEYAQTMLETGLLGMACVAAFGGLILAAAWRVMRRPVRSLDFLAFGLTLGFVAILIHSLSDFGQHVPAVALMTALTAAALCNLSGLHQARPDDDAGDKPRTAAVVAALEAGVADVRPRWLRAAGVAVLSVLVLGSGLAAVRLEGPRQAQLAFAAGRALEDRIYGTDPELIRPGDDQRMIRRYADAAELDPAVPDYAYRRDYFTWGLIGYDPQGNLRDVAGDPLATAEAQAVLSAIHASRRAYPTHGPLHGLAGEVLYFGLGDTQRGAELIARGGELTPHDPYLAFNAGNVAAREGDIDSAKQHFTRAVRLSDALRTDVVDVFLTELNDPDTAYAYAADRPAALRHLRDRLAARRSAADHADLIASIDTDLRNALVAAAYADDARPADLAAMARLLQREGEVDEAVALYQRAVALAPKQHQWELELGRIHADRGEVEEAIRAARRVLQLDPTSAAAQALLNEQVVLRGG